MTYLKNQSLLFLKFYDKFKYKKIGNIQALKIHVLKILFLYHTIFFQNSTPFNKIRTQFKTSSKTPTLWEIRRKILQKYLKAQTQLIPIIQFIFTWVYYDIVAQAYRDPQLAQKTYALVSFQLKRGCLSRMHLSRESESSLPGNEFFTSGNRTFTKEKAPLSRQIRCKVRCMRSPNKLCERCLCVSHFIYIFRSFYMYVLV